MELSFAKSPGGQLARARTTDSFQAKPICML